MNRLLCSSFGALCALVSALTLLAPGAVGAADRYRIQPIVRLGDMVGDLQIKGGFFAGPLNDNGQLIVVTGTWGAGGITSVLTKGEALLLQYTDTDGRLVPLVVPGRDAPGGTWAKDVRLSVPPSMNQRGNAVFSADVTMEGRSSSGTFLWDYPAQKIIPIAVPGMPAVDDRTFVQGGGGGVAINNRDEIAFTARLSGATGTSAPGLFYSPGRDAALQAVALPDQERPGGGKYGFTTWPTINDAGMIAFGATRPGESAATAYVWENGTVNLLAPFGAPGPDGRKIGVALLWVNNKNRNVLIESSPTGNKPYSLYRFADGQLRLVAAPGDEMPEGGQLQTIQYWGESAGNDLGHHAILAQLKDGGTAAYRVDADGKPTLILKSGMTTDLGVITRVGSESTQNGVGMNNKGQVALTLRIGDGPDTLALLTPLPQ